MVRHTPRRMLLLGLAVLLAPATPLHAQEAAAPAPRPYGAFAFTDSVLVPLSPDLAFDGFLRVDEWWDHRFSENPSRFFIEARPGGGFFEIFDESGDGVKHAEVIFVARGKTLRMRGPLGLSGFALDMVFNLDFEAAEAGTWVRLDVRGAGEMEEAWPGTVRDVWHHFLADRFKPYADGTLGGQPAPAMMRPTPFGV